MSDGITKLANTLKDLGKRHVKVNTAWATVKSVNWNKKTMTATGVMDELDYFNVILGLGNTMIKPKVKTRCLLGIIENHEAHAFLIMAEEVDEMWVDAVKIKFNGGSNKGLVNINPLKQELQRIDNALTVIKNAAGAAIAVYSGLIDGGSSAAAYNTAVNAILPQNLTTLENKDIEH